ncbi:C40 family peptidase [Nocardia callitridis]|uniref:NlpC/P60 domain-containing protein n=1 Tax=Nocardia callitridis TaxID=648753 RepID=A0ABP9K9P4_9NOCA
MAFSADVRPDRGKQGTVARVISVGAIAAAAMGATAMVAGPASAQQVSFPGIGTIEIGDDIPLPTGSSGAREPHYVMPMGTLGQRAVDVARGKIGSAYSMGAAGPDTFDCSGLVQWSYRQVGEELPRTSQAQLSEGTPTSREDLQPGDVVAFYGGSHSGLYAGDGNVIHASDYGKGVEVSPISSMPFAGARRY